LNTDEPMVSTTTLFFFCLVHSKPVGSRYPCSVFEADLRAVFVTCRVRTSGMTIAKLRLLDQGHAHMVFDIMCQTSR
jgi:hypothetical protein